MKLKNMMKTRFGRKAVWSLAAVLTLALAVSGCTKEDGDVAPDEEEQEAIVVSSTKSYLMLSNQMPILSSKREHTILQKI